MVCELLSHVLLVEKRPTMASTASSWSVETLTTDVNKCDSKNPNIIRLNFAVASVVGRKNTNNGWIF